MLFTSVILAFLGALAGYVMWLGDRRSNHIGFIVWEKKRKIVFIGPVAWAVILGAVLGICLGWQIWSQMDFVAGAGIWESAQASLERQNIWLVRLTVFLGSYAFGGWKA